MFNFTIRQEFRDLKEAMLYDSNSGDSSSSDSENDFDSHFCEVVFAPKRQIGNRVNLTDISVLECEQMFR